MALPPVPSEDEIVRLYRSGELLTELTQFHETGDGDEDAFLQQCILLHNRGSIDLVGLPKEAAFAALSGHSLFTLQHFYCEAIPKLDSDVNALMECCKILVENGGGDLAATQPNGALRTWFKNNPGKAAVVIREAQAGDVLAKRFVTFALQAAGDIDGAIDLIQSHDDDRRLSGMAALAGMSFAASASAMRAVSVLEPYVADSGDDHLRVNALLAAFDILKQYNDAVVAQRLIETVSKNPGKDSLYGLARIVWQYHAMLDGNALQAALTALEDVNPEHLGTLREIDMGLRQLLDTKDAPLALEYLTAKLRDGKFKIGVFESVSHRLSNEDQARLYRLIVRWFLSGSIALCQNASELVGLGKQRAFDTTVQPLDLTSVQKVFLCRKAIGYLFVRPVICCSIIVSVLRAADQNVEAAVSDLLFDPILLSYGGDAKDYLKQISATDPAYEAIQKALGKDQEFYAGLSAADTIKELHPSEFQRDLVRQRFYEELREAHKLAESKSVLLNLVQRSTILYGKRSLTYVRDNDGERRAVALDLKSFGASFELPRREILDPVGLDYMLRVFRVERLK